MDIFTPEFRKFVEAGAKWIEAHPNSSLGTTKVTGDFDSFCDALTAVANDGHCPVENIGLILRHSQALLKIGSEQYEEKLKYLNTLIDRHKPNAVMI